MPLNRIGGQIKKCTPLFNFFRFYVKLMLDKLILDIFSSLIMNYPSRKNSQVKFVINTLKEEKKIIELTKRKAKWFKKNRYSFTLPNQSLQAIYKKEEYLPKIEKIESEWKKQENQFFSTLEDFFGQKIKKKFIVHIGKYGVGGGYNLQNHVYINIALSYDPIRIIQHEILHLRIEPFVQKYKIKHQKKEKIINCLMELFR